MSKKKTFFSPSQMIFLTGPSVNENQSNGQYQWAKPDTFEDEEEDILLPEGETVLTENNDVVVPQVTGELDFTADEDIIN